MAVHFFDFNLHERLQPHRQKQILAIRFLMTEILIIKPSSLGDIVFVDLPQVGDALEKGVSLGDVESVKAVSEIISPVTGKVSAVNDALAASPEEINGDPYGAWIVEVTDVTDTAELLDAEAYKAVCEQA